MASAQAQGPPRKSQKAQEMGTDQRVEASGTVGTEFSGTARKTEERMEIQPLRVR